MRRLDTVIFLLIMALVAAGVIIVDAFANQMEERDYSNVVIEETNFIVEQFDDEVLPPEDPNESEKIEASIDWHYIEDCTLTAYCACSECCGKEGGITATGTVAQEGVTIAVDPDVIPLGSWVDVNGHQYHAEDVGGSVNGNHIDVYFDSHDQASYFGRQVESVRWYE